MASTLNVKVEINYDRLAEAIRKALRESLVVTSTPVAADDAVRAAKAEWEWREGGRVQ